MTKQDLQKELKEKVKEGIKPSQLKKLKRSKSDSDISTIPKASPLPASVPLTKSKSSEPFKDEKYPYTTLISQQEELEKLRKETLAKSETIKLLRKKIEELEKELKRIDRGLQSYTADEHLAVFVQAEAEAQRLDEEKKIYQDQLKVKQKEVEKLRKKLEEKNEELKTLKAAHSSVLDDNLSLKHQNLKDWWEQYQKTEQLDEELEKNVDYASSELEKQDKVIEKLRSENHKLKKTNQSLEKDLNLASKLAEWRRVPYPEYENNWVYLKYALYSLAGVVFTLWLVKSFKNIRESPNE